MSRWTHIVAAIDVDTNVESTNLEEEIKNFLDDAPKITGSEEDAEIFVNQLSGYNITHWNEEGESRFQTRVVITVIGDLRDRKIEQTRKEWKKFYNFISRKINGEGFSVRNVSCYIRKD